MQPVYPEVFELLESLNKSRLSIIETGCTYTRTIARWIARNPESTFSCVDLNVGELIETHHALESDVTARYCAFLSQEHAKWLNKTTWLDAAFLKPDDLKSGIEEFNLAASAGAHLIVFSDYQTRAAFAIKRAKEIGWQYESAGPLNILRRPK